MAEVCGKVWVRAFLRRNTRIILPTATRSRFPRTLEGSCASSLGFAEFPNYAKCFLAQCSSMRTLRKALPTAWRGPLPLGVGKCGVAWNLPRRRTLHLAVSAQTPGGCLPGGILLLKPEAFRGAFRSSFSVGRASLSTFSRRRVPPAPSPHGGAHWEASGTQCEEDATADALRRIQRGCAMIFFGLVGVAFAFVPAYQMFCRQTGYGGAVRESHGLTEGAEALPARVRTPGSGEKELLTIDFASHCNLPWDFKPLQPRLTVAPGESALAFYRARNKTNRPIIGMSLYHVTPPEAGIYFNKIQCFCFEEQLLNAQEEVDMPVFFFIDPDILKDPRFEQMRNITLSYVFFESESEIPEEYRHLTAATPSSAAGPVAV